MTFDPNAPEADLHKTLEVTNERLAQLASPPLFHPLHTINRAVSIALFGSRTLDRVFSKLLG